jgi:hypothetical protein
MSSPSAAPKPSKPVDLEVKDARLIFEPVWEALAAEVGVENLRFPKDDPARRRAGDKGTTRFIARRAASPARPSW